MKKMISCFLVDDDPDDREIFSLALHDINNQYSCIPSKNATEALEKLRSDSSFIPDFIFLDVNMPRISGKHCLREIRKITRLQQVPVIMYSTSSYEKDIEESKESGATHYMIKPSSIGNLSQMLSKVFQNKATAFLLTAE